MSTVREPVVLLALINEMSAVDARFYIYKFLRQNAAYRPVQFIFLIYLV